MTRTGLGKGFAIFIRSAGMSVIWSNWGEHFFSLSLSKWLPVQALPEEKLSHPVPRVQLLLAGSQGLPIYTILILTIG